MDVTAYRTGGTEVLGAIGDRVFFKVQGILKGNSTVEATTIIADTGFTTGWNAVTSFAGSEWGVFIRGGTNIDIAWSATANFNEMKT